MISRRPLSTVEEKNLHIAYIDTETVMQRLHVFSADIGTELVTDKKFCGVVKSGKAGLYSPAYIAPTLILVADLDNYVATVIALKATVFKEISIIELSPLLGYYVENRWHWWLSNEG